MTNAHEHYADQTAYESLPPAEAMELLTPSEARLLALLTPPQEVVDETHAQLQGVSQKAFSIALTPHEQGALKVAADIFEWRLFGRRGDPLPAGLVQGYDAKGKYGIAYDLRTEFSSQCISMATAHLRAAGLNAVGEHWASSVKERSEEIGAMVTELIKETNAYAFIQALASGATDSQRQERPLTPFWRRVGETKTDDALRVKWLLDRQAPIEHDLNARKDLSRRVWRLEDETMPADADSLATPLTRVRSYLQELVQAEAHRLFPDEADIEYVKGVNGKAYLRSARYPEGFITQDRIEESAMQKLAGQIAERGPHMAELAAAWLNELSAIVLNPTKANDFDEANEVTLEDAQSDLVDEAVALRLFDEGDYAERTTSEGLLHAGLLVPSGRFLDVGQRPQNADISHRHGSAPRNWIEITTLHDSPVGEVLRFSPNTRGKHAKRLLRSEIKARDISLPPLQGGEEVVIRLYDNEFDNAGLQPHIPGYRLVSKTQDVYGFVPDEAGDPYAPADIALTAEQQARLAAQYAGLGLQELAHAVRRKSHLTVQDLVSLISEKGRYVTASEASNMRPRLGTTALTQRLSEFKPHVRDGILRVQCSGAAVFLRLSLEELFGQGTAMVVEGILLERRTVSTASTHAQTAFTHEGRTYLLDATPGASPGSRLTLQHNDYLFGGLGFRLRNLRRRPTVPLRSLQLAEIDNPPPPEAGEENTEPRHRPSAQAVRASFDRQLVALFGTTSVDAAYQKVNALPHSDPLSKTVEVTLRASYGEASRDDVVRLQKYLAAFQTADSSLYRQMGLRPYSKETIGLLQNTAEQLLGGISGQEAER